MQKTIALNNKNVEKAQGPVGGSMPLAMANAGNALRVCSIRGKDDTCRFLSDLGFVEGADVSVVNEMGGNLIVEVKGSRVGISRSMAMRIMVA